MFTFKPLIPNSAVEMAHKIENAGGRLFLVGGWVRDLLMGLTPKDLDFAVEGLTEQELKRVLPDLTPINEVAPVFSTRLDGELVEVALCRKEVSTGPKKTDFVFESTDIFEDLQRRDICINAMAVNCATAEFIDPFGGLADIQLGLLRHVSDAFQESPERVFRVAVKFACRFGFDIADDTFELMREMTADWQWGFVGKNSDTLAIVGWNGEKVVPTQQLWDQGWRDFFSNKNLFPEKALQNLSDLGLDRLFSELFGLKDCPQRNDYHQEGNTLIHTLLVFDEMGKLI